MRGVVRWQEEKEKITRVGGEGRTQEELRRSDQMTTSFMNPEEEFSPFLYPPSFPSQPFLPPIPSSTSSPSSSSSFTTPSRHSITSVLPHSSRGVPPRHLRRLPLGEGEAPRPTSRRRPALALL
ncbi:hypothetical protein E2C01_000586 [Portunus trituberculatus]|uniref:Uncharacterized protein n=1 Tax=Portunus trituberculatus TaxID=210409 RepID=A0A5B7CF37_PORTR|nr:hypothetical protein [Portunus trituberculatus]